MKAWLAFFLLLVSTCISKAGYYVITGSGGVLSGTNQSVPVTHEMGLDGSLGGGRSEAILSSHAYLSENFIPYPYSPQDPPVTSTVNYEGIITMTFTWKPTVAEDPPQAVIVQQAITLNVNGGNYARCENGYGLQEWYTTKRIVVKDPGNTFKLKWTPFLESSSTRSYYQQSHNEPNAQVISEVSTSNVDIELSGVVDPKGDAKALIGQTIVGKLVVKERGGRVVTNVASASMDYNAKYAYKSYVYSTASSSLTPVVVGGPTISFFVAKPTEAATVIAKCTTGEEEFQIKRVITIEGPAITLGLIRVTDSALVKDGPIADFRVRGPLVDVHAPDGSVGKTEAGFVFDNGVSFSTEYGPVNAGLFYYTQLVQPANTIDLTDGSKLQQENHDVKGLDAFIAAPQSVTCGPKMMSFLDRPGLRVGYNGKWEDSATSVVYDIRALHVKGTFWCYLMFFPPQGSEGSYPVPLYQQCWYSRGNALKTTTGWSVVPPGNPPPKKQEPLETYPGFPLWSFFHSLNEKIIRVVP